MLRLSHSQLKCFDNCKRQYYHKYIAKDPEKDVETKWFHFGSAMHSVLEKHHEHKLAGKTFDYQEEIRAQWQKYKLDGRMDFNEFRLCVLNGVQYDIDVTHTEMKIFVPVGNHQFVGYLDVVDTTNDIILDWKSGTYSKQKEDEYKKQLQCYAYLYWRKFERIPKRCIIFFNKGNKPIEFAFTKEEVLDYEAYILRTAAAIMKMRETMSKDDAEQNFSACFFCGYKYLCFSKNAPVYEYEIVLKGNCGFLSGHITPTLQEGLDRSLRFELKNRHFMQQAIVAKNGGKRPKNYDDIGVVHLYNKIHRMFNIGSLTQVKKILKDYAEYNSSKAEIRIKDLREKEVLEKKLSIMPEKLLGGKELRDYQIEAAEAFIHFGGMGYIEVGTGGGKTLITAELIRLMDTTTLWVIDRKELLYQTKEYFEHELGIPIGIIGDGKSDIKDVTVATIQTLTKDISKYKSYLERVNFLIVDEGHKASAESYQELCRHCSNTKYRLGTTGTVRRDDKKDPIMLSLIGPVIYKKGAKELEEAGHLMKPTIRFMDLNDQYVFGQEYHEVYEEAIMNNDARNDKIKELVVKHRHEGHKILVLTSRIEHGEKIYNLLRADREDDVYYLHGSVDMEVRKEKFQQFKTGDINILVGTLSIFSEGIDVPDLDVIINAAANRAEVKTVQTLGRVLRQAEGKKGAFYYDFIDNAKFLDTASKERMKAFRDEGHEVEQK